MVRHTLILNILKLAKKVTLRVDKIVILIILVLVLAIKPRALCMLDQHSTAKLRLQSTEF
jgi:hypothetical protein